MSNRARENEFWTPEPVWHGQTCFVLASGPSLTSDLAERVCGRHTIVVNSSCLLAPWADILFFTDNGWFERHQDIVADWPGMVITLSRATKRALPDKVKRVRGELRPDFPPLGADHVRQGRSSGHTAVSVALALGAGRIVLLGYDMRLVDGREHHHDDYAGTPRDLAIYKREFVPGFTGWAAAARRVGAEIVNATPGSAVSEFTFVSLDRILAE